MTGIGLRTLATMLGTSQERVMRRADELGVSLVIGSDHDTRTLRCSDGLRRPATGTAEADTRRPEVNHMFAFAVFDLAQTHQFLAANDKTNLTARCFKQAKNK